MPTSPDPDHADTLPADDAPLDAVRREVVLDATPERVWAALADDDGLAGWLADEVDLEVRQGATGTVRDGDGPRREITVEEVVPGSRLGLSWRDVGGRESVVDLALEPTDEGRTRVVVVEVPLATLRLVAPAAERLLTGGRPGGGPSAAGSAPTASGWDGGAGRVPDVPWSSGPAGSAATATRGPGRRPVGARCVLAGAR